MCSAKSSVTFQRCICGNPEAVEVLCGRNPNTPTDASKNVSAPLHTLNMANTAAPASIHQHRDSDVEFHVTYLDTDSGRIRREDFEDLAAAERFASAQLRDQDGWAWWTTSRLRSPAGWSPEAQASHPTHSARPAHSGRLLECPPCTNGDDTPWYFSSIIIPSAAWSKLWQWSIQMPGLSA